MNIETGILIQIIASSVSLTGIIMGIVFAWIDNRRSKYVEIITNQTIRNMIFLRDSATLFCVLIKPEIISEARNNTNNYKFQLLQTAAGIEAIMKYRFDKEREMINIVRIISKHCLKYYDEPEPMLEEELRILGDKFYKLISLYDYSDWLYIKSQTSKKPYKNFPDYDKIYDEQNIIFKKSEEPMRW